MSSYSYTFWRPQDVSSTLLAPPSFIAICGGRIKAEEAEKKARELAEKQARELAEKKARMAEQKAVAEREVKAAGMDASRFRELQRKSPWAECTRRPYHSKRNCLADVAGPASVRDSPASERIYLLVRRDALGRSKK